MTATDDDHLRKFEGHHGGASNEEDDTRRGVVATGTDRAGQSFRST
jgi:hypothetical protein